MVIQRSPSKKPPYFQLGLSMFTFHMVTGTSSGAYACRGPSGTFNFDKSPNRYLLLLSLNHTNKITIQREGRKEGRKYQILNRTHLSHGYKRVLVWFSSSVSRISSFAITFLGKGGLVRFHCLRVIEGMVSSFHFQGLPCIWVLVLHVGISC